jgi:multiple sugar transport system substrate-binding protein
MMVIKRHLIGALALGACLSTGMPAKAQTEIVWWDFLGGGDGVRMKTLIDEFNADHDGQISIQASTLEWGVPFYSKVQTSVTVGEGPDIMTYHTSRIPLAASQNLLQEITADDLATMGLGEADFAPTIWDAVHQDGKMYAVPLDTHPIVLYYNKDKLGAAGLLDDAGLPKGLSGIENFSAALQALQDGGTTWGMSTFTAGGNFQFRTIYSLLCQQDGELLSDGEWLAGDSYQKLVNAVQVLSDWVADDHVPAYTEYPAAVALFTSGEAAMHINGVWEVPTMIDLYDKGELFEWGAIELPVFFDHACTYSDSHAFALPDNQGKEMSAEKRAAVLTVMRWMLDRGLFWASAGHIPALNAVTASAEYQAMQPNATYAVLTSNMVYDPKSEFAGVASPLFEAAGNAFTAAVNGEMDADEAVEIMKEELDALQ